jgi:hypothetical protein
VLDEAQSRAAEAWQGYYQSLRESLGRTDLKEQYEAAQQAYLQTLQEAWTKAQSHGRQASGELLRTLLKASEAQAA